MGSSGRGQLLGLHEQAVQSAATNLESLSLSMTRGMPHFVNSSALISSDAQSRARYVAYVSWDEQDAFRELDCDCQDGVEVVCLDRCKG